MFLFPWSSPALPTPPITSDLGLPRASPGRPHLCTCQAAAWQGPHLCLGTPCYVFRPQPDARPGRPPWCPSENQPRLSPDSLATFFISLNCPARPGNPTPTDLCKRGQFTNLEAKLREGQGARKQSRGRGRSSPGLFLSVSSPCPRPRPRETPRRRVPTQARSLTPRKEGLGPLSSSSARPGEDPGIPTGSGVTRHPDGARAGRGVSASTQTTDRVGGGRRLTVLVEEPGKCWKTEQ